MTPTFEIHQNTDDSDESDKSSQSLLPEPTRASRAQTQSLASSLLKLCPFTCMYGAPSLATWHGDMNVSHCVYFSLSIHIASIPYGDWERRTVEVLGEVLLWQNLTHGEVLLWEVLGEALLWEALVEGLLWKVLGEILLQKYLAHGEVLAQSGNLPQSPLSPMSLPAQCWRRWTRHPQMNRATAQSTL